MINEIFKYMENEVRVTGTKDEPVFCLSDVCKILELRVAKVIERLGDDVLSKGVVVKHPVVDRLGRIQQMYFVNESGLYDVIFDSRKPIAKKFRKWITDEVLPSIRKRGAYIDPNHESVRSLNIMLRKYETSAIARLIEYGRRQGYSINDAQVYSSLTYHTQTEFCGIPVGGRSIADSSELLDLIAAESIVINTIYKGILWGMSYSAIYKAIVERTKYYFLDDIKFVYDKEFDLISAEVKEKNHNIVVKWDGIKVKIPKKE